MSWTLPQTWTTGAVLSKADLDTHVRDNLNFLKTNIALEAAVELTIDTGAVTKTYSHHAIDTEGDAASDDLDTISGGAEGEVILIRPADGARTVVLKHNTGNIWSINGGDITLDDADDYALLVYSGSKWCIIGGGGGAVDTSGTPADNEYAKFTDANTIEGRSYAELLSDINVEAGADVTDATNVAAAGAVMESDLLITLGVELAPVMTQAAWTEGAGWTINDGAGTATRVAAASTTMVPTSAIVPDVDKNYKVTFVISSWTAGTMTVTLGGAESTPLQGDQTVHLYVSPYTTGNLIFTPDADFAGVITLVSVKEYTGGEITVDGDVLYYDSRGHSNRLSHVTRHLSEMQTDTLLDKSRSSLSCTGGVLTYTLYAVYGNGTWNFNGVVYPIDVASASVALTGGTDAVPKANHIYFKLVNNVPTLSVSLDADPTGNYIRVATFIVGAVSGSSYTVYSYHRNRREVDTLVNRVINRSILAGTLYDSGALPTVTSTTLSIASGGKWLQGIFPMVAANTVTAAGGYFFVDSTGAFVQSTSLADLHHYANGVALGASERQNIVWGIVPTTTTASGTLPSTVRLVAVLQSEPTAVYGSDSAARQDAYEATNYFPPNSELKKVFVPIARTIVKPNDAEFRTFDTGIYWKDVRGRITSGGGAATATDTSALVPKSLYDAYSILFATTDDTPAALVVAEQEVVGRMTGGTIDGIALGMADNNILQIDEASGISDNDFLKATAAGVEGRTYAEVKTDLTLNLVENTAHSTDAHTMTIDGVDVSAHDVATTGVHGVGAGTIAKTADITATKLDDLATPDANTDLNANTTNHGLLLQATAPGAGLMNFVGLTNGETAYLNKPLFDTTNPEALGAAAPGTSLIAARRDHVHAAPVGGDITTDGSWAAKGDLIVGTGENTAAILTVGTNGKVLTAASGEATGLKWDTAGTTDPMALVWAIVFGG
jgi:hypothetical protein